MKRNSNTAYCRPCCGAGTNRGFIRTCNSVFNERLTELIKGQNADYSPIDLGCPSTALLSAGIPDLPIQVSVNKLMIKKEQNNHPFKLSDVAHLPEYLCYPIAVFRSASTVEDRKVVLTEMECDGTNIVVILAPNQIYKGYNVNSVRSIYPKDNFAVILGWITVDKLMEYANKQKILKWLGKQQSNSADVTRLLKDTTKIIQMMEDS